MTTASTATSTLTEQATRWLDAFETALTQRDLDAVVALFHDESYWRDLVAFTWNIKTLEGPAQIREMLEARLADVAPRDWRVDGETTEANGIIEAWVTFETRVAHGRGRLRLRDGKCFTLLTVAQDLDGHEEQLRSTRPVGTENRIVPGMKSWGQLRAEEEAALGYEQQPYCVIIGGGQGGIALGARLRQLDVPTIIIERNARPGDSWRNRYESLCLHDPVWYDHMPYIPFPDHWPIYTPKDQLGDWLEMYTKVMNLNYWGSTTCTHAEYDEESERWTVEVNRDGEVVTLRPNHLILATGMSGVPNVPALPGADTFEGAQMHSSAFTSGAPFRGKHAVVLGSNNSAHDICAALWANGADVTMVQRSGTTVARSDTLAANRTIYSQQAADDGLSTETADMLSAATPYRLMHLGGIEGTKRIRERDAEFYAALEAAGFMLDFGEDESGLGMKYQRRGSGYYIDTGASELVIRGDIKVRSRVTIERINPRSVTLSDSNELPVDLIVYATGYGSMNGWAARLISQEVADRVGKVWGIGSDTAKDPGPWEGEQRNMWKPTQQPGLWFHGGNLAQSRFYSKLLALQLKARYEGIATPTYGVTPPHHRE
ncbi:MAG: NAD(P)/FAD-dependent oxidoreductase [Chloroflexota bacterium]